MAGNNGGLLGKVLLAVIVVGFFAVMGTYAFLGGKFFSSLFAPEPEGEMYYVSDYFDEGEFVQLESDGTYWTTSHDLADGTWEKSGDGIVLKEDANISRTFDFQPSKSPYTADDCLLAECETDTWGARDYTAKCLFPRDEHDKAVAHHEQAKFYWEREHDADRAENRPWESMM